MPRGRPRKNPVTVDGPTPPSPSAPSTSTPVTPVTPSGDRAVGFLGDTPTAPTTPAPTRRKKPRAKPMVSKAPTPRAELKKAYRFTVYGQYHAKAQSGYIPKNFTQEKFILPEVVSFSEGRRWEEGVNSQGAPIKKSIRHVKRANPTVGNIALQLIMHYYLPPRLKEKYPDFARVRHVEMATKERVLVDPSLVRDIHKIAIEDMTEGELLQFHALSDLKCNIQIYNQLSDKKVAVQRELDQMKKEREKEKAQSEFDPSMEEATVKLTDEVVTGHEYGVPQREESDILGNLL